MVHKSDVSWTAKVNNPSDMYKKGDDVEAIILSINHDEKKVSLGVKQLWDDPWPTIFNELPPGSSVTGRVLSIVDYGVFVHLRDGIDGLITQNDLVLPKDESGKDKPLHVGDEIQAEIANIDSQERRITLSMRKGVAAAPASVPGEAKTPARTASRPPKKTAAADAAGGTIGELIKQKLGSKLATIGNEKKDEEDKDEESTDDENE